MQDDSLLPPPPTPQKGFFGPKPQPQQPDLSFKEDVTALTSRIRINEERMGELRKKLLLIEQNMLAQQKKSANDLRVLQADIIDSKHTIQAIEDKIITVIKELRLTSRKEDMDVMKKYIELWNPVKFVTRDAVETIIDDKLGKHEDHKPPRYDSP